MMKRSSLVTEMNRVTVNEKPCYYTSGGGGGVHYKQKVFEEEDEVYDGYGGVQKHSYKKKTFEEEDDDGCHGGGVLQKHAYRQEYGGCGAVVVKKQSGYKQQEVCGNVAKKNYQSQQKAYARGGAKAYDESDSEDESDSDCEKEAFPKPCGPQGGVQSYKAYGREEKRGGGKPGLARKYI